MVDKDGLRVHNGKEQKGCSGNAGTYPCAKSSRCSIRDRLERECGIRGGCFESQAEELVLSIG